MQRRTVFGNVGFLPVEHGVDPASQAGFLGQLQEEPEGLVGNAVLRVIQDDPHGFCRHALAAFCERQVGESRVMA